MQNSRTGFEYLMGFADSVVYSGSAGAGFAALENSNKTTHRKFYKRALESHVQSGPIWANMTHKFRRQLAQWPLWDIPFKNTTEPLNLSRWLKPYKRRVETSRPGTPRVWEQDIATAYSAHCPRVSIITVHNRGRSRVRKLIGCTLLGRMTVIIARCMWQ